MVPSSLPVLSGDKDQLLQQALGRLAASPKPGGPDADAIVTATRRLPAVAATYAPFPAQADDRLKAALAARGIEQLYTHQAEAIEHALAGRNVVTITPTASGKTLCYNAPVLDAILKDPSTRALYLFPTKALAQDQLAELHALVGAGDARDGAPEIGVFTYDGDTPSDARRAIRGKAHVVLSNPDMLHSGILPHHPRWAKLFENLKFVVIDELHAYRGVFGSHLSNIMRRLQRVCRHYGSDPIFICSSATIANPRELAEGLTGRSFELVEQSGAPRGEKFFLFVNPPVVNAQLGIRRSYLAETRRVALEFLKRNLQLIVFAQSRLATEILTTYLKDAFQGPPGAADVIRGYRGGYLPNRRREIERGLREGSVRAVVSTNALELGHRHRRARRLGDGRLSGHDRRDLAARRPRRPPIHAVGGGAGREQRADRSVHRPQPVVLLRRVARARADQSRQPAHPARPREVRGVRAAVRRWTRRSGRRTCRRSSRCWPKRASSTHADGQWNWTHESYPADAVSLRSVSSDNFVVVDTTQRRAGDRRDRLHERPGDAAREGDLHHRRTALPGRAPRLRRPQGLRPRGRLRLLHRRDHVHEGDDSRYVCVGERGSGIRDQGRSRRSCFCGCSRSPTPDLRPPRARSAPTARSTSSPASSASRRSSSTPTRTSGRASSICPSSRCTRRRTG